MKHHINASFAIAVFAELKGQRAVREQAWSDDKQSVAGDGHSEVRALLFDINFVLRAHSNALCPGEGSGRWHGRRTVVSKVFPHSNVPAAREGRGVIDWTNDDGEGWARCYGSARRSGKLGCVTVVVQHDVEEDAAVVRVGIVGRAERQIPIR